MLYFLYFLAWFKPFFNTAKPCKKLMKALQQVKFQMSLFEEGD